MPFAAWKPDAPLEFLESSTTLMKGLDTITRKAAVGGWVGGGGQEAVGVKIGASVDSANNIPTLHRD